MIVWVVTATLFCPTLDPQKRTDFPKESIWETESGAQHMASVYRDIGTFNYADRENCHFYGVSVRKETL